MKVLANETKRILAVLLSVAMIFAYVPNNVAAYADDDVPAAESETVENGDVISAEPQNNNEEMEGAGEDLIVDDPELSKADVELQLNLEKAPSVGHMNYAYYNSGDRPTTIALGETTAMAPVEGSGTGMNAKRFTGESSTQLGYVQVDSTRPEGYSFYVKADKGYAFKTKPVVKVEYNDFHTVNSADYDDPDLVKAAAVKLEEPSSSTYTVTPVTGDARLVLVTLTHSFLEKVEKGSYYADYDATRTAKKTLRFNPQIKITVDGSNGLRSKEFPMTSLKLSSDISGSDMHADSIDVAKRTAQFIPTMASTTGGMLIDDLGDYITGKVITAEMITVTYTPLTADADFSDEVIDIVATSAAIDDEEGNYVRYASKDLTLYGEMINDFVTGDADLTVSIDGSLADAKYKTVSVATNPYVAGVFKTTTKDALSGKFACDEDLKFDVVLTSDEKATTRTIKKVVATEKTDGTEYTAIVDGAAVGSRYVYKLPANAVDDDITISVETVEAVNVTNVATGMTVYDTTGKEIDGDYKIPSGTQNFQFDVVPSTGKVIDKVKYTLETDEDWIDATLVAGNTYSIPASVTITSSLSILTAEKAADADKTVVIKNTGSAASWAAVTDTKATGVAHVYSGTKASEAAEFKGTTWKIDHAAADGKYYYFTVVTEAGYVPDAKCYFGNETDYTKYTDAVLVTKNESTRTYVYRTDKTVPVKAAEVDLCIRARKAVVINKPKNTMVESSFGDSTIVPADESYSFSITTKPSSNGTVVIKKVGYTIDGTVPNKDTDFGTNVLTLSGGVYTLGNDVLTAVTGSNPVNLFVQTEETVTSGYSVKFALANDSEEYPSLSGDVGNQKLTLNYGGTTGKLTAEFKTTGRVPTTLSTGKESEPTTTKGAEGMYPASYATPDAKGKNIVLLENKTNASAVKANKVGTDTITSTLIKDNTDGDKKVYSADLAVEVDEAWSDLEIFAFGEYLEDEDKPAIMANENGTNYTNGEVGFGIKGKNAKTKELDWITDLTSGVTKVEYSFDPANDDALPGTETYLMGANSGMGWSYMRSSLTNPASNTIFVRAKDTTTPEVTIKATVTLESGNKVELESKPLTIIEEASYAPFVTYKLSDGVETEVPWEIDGDDKIVTKNGVPNPTLELVAGGRKTETIDYPVYKQLEKVATVVPETAEELQVLVTAGDYEPVTSGITYEAYMDDALKPYVSATNTGSKFTITGLKKGEGEVYLNAYKDGVLVSQDWVYVTVVNGIGKSTVELQLDDVGTYTLNDDKTVSTPVQQKLTSSTYTSKINSIIEPNNNVKVSKLVTDGTSTGAGIVSTRGIEFTAETPDSAFVLPTQSDFDSSKIGKGRILVGWQNTDSNEYYYPGESYSVSDENYENVFKAVWADRYSFGTDAITAAGDDLGNGAVLYNGLLTTSDDENVIVDCGKFAAVDKVTPTTITTHGAIAGGNHMPLMIKLAERIPYTKELKADVKGGFGNFEEATSKDIFKGGSALVITTDGTEKARLKVDTAKGEIYTDQNVAAIAEDPAKLTVSASWTDSVSGKTFETYAIPVAVEPDNKYTVAFDEDNPTSLLVDQSSNNTLAIVLKKDGAEQTKDNTTNFKDLGFEFKTTSDSIVELTPAVSANEVGTECAEANIVEVTPLAVGTATINVTVKDKKGMNKSATSTLEVKSNGVNFTITDIATNATVTGAENSPLLAKADDGTAAVVASTNYTINGSPAVTFNKDVEGDGDVIAATGSTFGTDGKTLTIKAADTSILDRDDLSDEGYVIVGYKKNGDTSGTEFEKKLHVSTYYEIILEKTSEADIYNNGKKVVDASDNATNGIARVTMANRQNLGTEEIPNYVYKDIDISSFSAKSDDTTKTWIGWKKKNKTLSPTEKYHYTDKIDLLKSSDTDGTNSLRSGLYTIDPVIVNNPITKAVVGQTTVRLSNEDDFLTSTTEKINEKKVELNVEPYDTEDEIVLVPEKNKGKIYTYKAGETGDAGKVGYKIGAGTVVPVTATLGKITLPYGDSAKVSGKTTYDGAVYVDTTKKERIDNFNVAAITGEDRRAGSVVFDVQSKASGASLGTVTFNINGFDSVDKKYYENGNNVVSDSRTVNNETYFFDDKGIHVEGDAIITKANGAKIAIDNGALVPANTMVTLTGDYAGTYYVKPDGTIANNEIYKVSGVDRLFRENGTIVTYTDTDVVDGKIKVSNKGYVIDPTTSAAKLDDILYNPVVTMSPFPAKWNKSSIVYPVVTYTIEATSKNTGNKVTASGNAVVTSNPGTIPSNATEAEFIATVDLSQYYTDATGATPVKEPAKKSIIFRFKDGGDEGISDVYYDPVIKWGKWPKTWDKGTLYPTVTYSVTYTSANDGTKTTVENITASVAPTETITTSANKVTFVATANLSGYYHDKEGKVAADASNTKNVTDKQDYKFKKDSPSGNAAGGESGSSESEPEEQAESGAAQNLFYTDVELSIPGFASSGAETTGTGKWTQYYSVGSDGTVTVKPTDAKTRKTAANASNSLIVLPIKEGDVQVGELHYALPVYYAKPSLKLSSTKGTIKKGETEQSVKTKVSEKKSNGAYEPLDLSDQKVGIDLYAPKNSSAVKVSEISTDGSEITIPATGKTSGKIQVQLDNWCDKVELNYTVAESTKDVLTVDKKTVYMNTTANADGEAQTVTLLINGREVTSDDGITVTYPKNFDQKNIDIGGVTEGKVEGSEITVAYKTDAAPVKGNYTLKFVKGTSKASVKISVSNLDPKTANKAVTTKIQTKMNLTTGQKMVLIPQLKGIGGEISDVQLDTASAELFNIDYNEEVGQIYLWPKDVTKVNTTTQYKPEITITVGGVECKAQPKFKPQATKPTVKIDKVTLDKNKVKTATDGSTGVNAAANVLCTYKLGGKTFTIDPIEEGGVEFYEGNTKLSPNASTGMYTLKNGAAFRLVYDKSEGILKLTDYQQAQGKGATVKVHLMFPGQTKAIVKSFSIKTK